MSITLDKNGLEMTLFHPEQDGARLGSRYSHAGYISQLSLRGTQLLSMPRAPFEVFHGCGFPDEFEAPLGYDDAEIGEGFLKIGVGVIEKVEDRPYTNWDQHPVIRRAHSDIEVSPESVTFHQHASLGSVAYDYDKTIELLEEGQCRIQHVLKNSGTIEWSSDWYSHIFLDRSLFMDPLLLELPSEWKNDKDNHLSLKDPAYLVPASDCSNGLDGNCYRWNCPLNSENWHTLTSDQAAYRMRASEAASSFMTYCNQRICSPEPRRVFRLRPNETKHWSSLHHFCVNP